MLSRVMLLALLFCSSLGAAEYWVAPVPVGKDC